MEKKKTKVICIYGGPCTGKSTLSSGLYYLMKTLGYDVELVREYAKLWAYEKRNIKNTDQMFITGSQIHSETMLYNKVEYIITDSPVLLGSIYEEYYSGQSSIINGVKQIMKNSILDDIEYYHFILDPLKDYQQNGRFETQEEAINLHNFLKIKIKDWLIDIYKGKDVVNYLTDDTTRIYEITKILGFANDLIIDKKYIK